MKFVLISVTALTLFSCAKNVEEELIIDDTPENVTYSGTISPLFKTSCAISGCHTGSSPTAGLNLGIYDNVITVITPNSPEESRLYGVITHTQLPNMPLNRPKLSDAAIENVKTWILDGAKND